MTNEQLTHLIIVPCHGIWKGSNYGSKTEDWWLESFQVEGHDHLLFIEHIKIGIEKLKEDPKALLLFSGGQTKKQAGPVSEAQSYYALAEKLDFITDETKDRVSTEEFARDSFENVLFGLARFYEIVEQYPENITIPGFEFKRSRFLDLHLPALNFPSTRIEYIGVDPKPDYETGSPEHKKYFNDLAKAEKKNALSLFEQDPFGTGAVLSKKRANRNPFKRHHGYVLTNKVLKPFFSGGPSEVQTLPSWD